MTNAEKLKGYLIQYPFLQDLKFCGLLGVPQSSLKKFVTQSKGFNDETIERILPLIESIHFSIVAWKLQYGKNEVSVNIFEGKTALKIESDNKKYKTCYLVEGNKVYFISENADINGIPDFVSFKK